MYHVSAQGVDERVINIHYYYYYDPTIRFLCVYRGASVFHLLQPAYGRHPNIGPFSGKHRYNTSALQRFAKQQRLCNTSRHKIHF